jgi:hypothetical protein
MVASRTQMHFSGKVTQENNKVKDVVSWCPSLTNNFVFQVSTPQVFTGNQKVSKFVCDLVKLGITLQDSPNKT